jgi:hypothetical protein
MREISFSSGGFLFFHPANFVLRILFGTGLGMQPIAIYDLSLVSTVPVGFDTAGAVMEELMSISASGSTLAMMIYAP